MGLSWGNSVREFQKTTKKTVVDMNKRIVMVQELTGKDIKKDAQANTPKLSGKLRAGWKLVKVRSARRAKQVEVVNDVPYGVYVENGTSKQPPPRS